MASKRAAIQDALVGRLESITAANGYDVTVQQVYADKIPMGLELEDFNMPAVFVLDEGAAYEHDFKMMKVARSFRLQLVMREDATDSDVGDVLRAIAKSIWANHATAEVMDAFRFHELVYWVEMTEDETDLHMIESNRIATAKMIVHYRTKPYDL